MYSQEITRSHPACILFVVDQSHSMSHSLSGSEFRKCDQLAEVMNGWLQNMIITCWAGESGIRRVRIQIARTFPFRIRAE